nr:MAG: putative coat protein P3 [Sobemovirus sp.]
MTRKKRTSNQNSTRPSGSNSRVRRRVRRSGLNQQMQNLQISRPMAAPVSTGVVTGRMVPSISSSNDVTTVRFAEIVMNLEVSNGPTSASAACMPSDMTSWLSGVARSWSKWHWDVLKYVYIPCCPATTSGSVHMGFQYDWSDDVPSNDSEISSLHGYTSGPVWGGENGAVLLNPRTPYTRCPVGAICSEIDVGRTMEYWYPYVSKTRFANESLVAAALVNLRTPARLVVLTTDGPSDAVKCGRIYAIYQVKLIEPISSALNDPES